MQEIISVSIAGAILWGVLPKNADVLLRIATVSIAGAILWGVLHLCPHTPCLWK